MARRSVSGNTPSVGSAGLASALSRSRDDVLLLQAPRPDCQPTISWTRSLETYDNLLGTETVQILPGRLRVSRTFAAIITMAYHDIRHRLARELQYTTQERHLVRPEHILHAEADEGLQLGFPICCRLVVRAEHVVEDLGS